MKHRIFQQEPKTQHRIDMEQKQVLSVKLPDKPNGRSIVVCLSNLIGQVTSEHLDREVSNIKVNCQERSLEIHFN